MARGSAQNGPPAVPLPKVEYEIAKDDVCNARLPPGTEYKKYFSYGYNDDSEFQRPEYYIRHVEPLESDLAVVVEYDMDEQDFEWLEVINVERKKAGAGAVKCEDFEIVMDRLEKEWFDFTKNIPKTDFAMPSEDSTCAICDDAEGENSNAIVFCDGCNLAVHQDCYGVPYIPEGQWLCRKCTVSPENPVECSLCPNEGGAFKQTLEGQWVHLLCAIWVPETRVANDVFMEPITGLDRVSKGRWKLRCEICGEKGTGACIQCTKPSCFSAFHTTCARKEKLLMPMKSAHGTEPAALTAYCDRHLPLEQQEIRKTALKAEESSNNHTTTKSARAYAKTYRPGPPLIPAIIVDRIVKYIHKLPVRKKPEFVQLVSRYWSLKRESRRGAPLLKRLHLEPWTAGAGGKVSTEEEKLMKLDQLRQLRDHLEAAKTFNDLVKKRETRKLRQAEVIYDVLAKALFPHHGLFRLIFDKYSLLDKDDLLKTPVSTTVAPDYYNVIEKPRCWDMIEAKLDNHEYWDLQAFLDDMHLIADNALVYNKEGSTLHRLGQHIRRYGTEQLDPLPPLRFLHDLNLPSAPSFTPEAVSESAPDEARGPNEVQEEELACIYPARPTPGVLGDLEPYLDFIELLISSDAIRADLNIELDNSEPIASLFNYELAKLKPPPPDSPAVEKKIRISTAAAASNGEWGASPSMKQGKKDKSRGKKKIQVGKKSKAALAAEEYGVEGIESQGVYEGQATDTGKKSQKQRDRDIQAALDASAGFMAPRTRGARAAVAAFEAEAGVDVAGSSAAGESRVANKPRSTAPLGMAQSTSLPGNHPRVVNAVDNRDSFNLFNAGWILPPDQKRGGRAPPSTVLPPPPKKKQKIDHAAFGEAGPSSEVRTSPEADISMEVDPSNDHGPSRGRALSSATDEIDVPHNVVTQPNGTIIIEKLDTPAIRRERSMRKKAERQRQSQPDAGGNDDPNDAGPSNLKHKAMLEDLDDESELSELSEDEDAEGEDDVMDGSANANGEDTSEAAAPAVKSKGHFKKPPKKRMAKLEQYEDSTIVWAKSEAFPWWPAVVYSEDNEQVPRNILQAHKEKKHKRKIKLFIVQFYDKQTSWQSVGRDKLLLLGEDEALDQEMLGSGSKQKWKSSASKKECHDAYQQALADMEGNKAERTDAAS